ncbi:hypothetical protein PHYBOEH_009187 [Phytophthora boehmeriae]|uniref:RxLR effector protein n=1 Tax=Phytophthora boehmeriae TaxID=109152 RepID=A0A8T1VYV2_9STRA|nr:hypothetical protein PHYBOEH_009187 [Phytophthora boehmeriae]
MRLLYVILVAVTILFSVVTATNANHAKVAKVAKAATPDSTVADRMLGTAQHKRFLRVENTAGEDDEERAVFVGALKKLVTKIKHSKPVSRVKYEYWLLRGENPNTIKVKLGLSGLTPVQAEEKVNAFRDYLAFNELWRKKKSLFSTK